ncbi:MAG: hypothetical protein OXC99_10680 [Chloroflexi bacterium]|nr:hypothetical protein [Chloroflexota bacterium]
MQQLKHHDLIASEAEFIADDILTEAVYLDWLLRPQVGCVFAQLLARPIHRTGFMTVVARGSSGAGKPIELATQIADLATEAVRDPSTEALTVLLPQVLDDQSLATLAWELGNKPGWKTELNRRWQKGLVLVGLRVEIKEKVFAETLGMGPFPTFPTTRQSPVTSLEIRTDPKRAKRSKLSRGYLAAHLADIPIDFLTNEEFRVRFSTHTPKLRKRILGTPSDQRAKAGVTYTIQAPIWDALKGQYSSQVVAGD